MRVYMNSKICNQLVRNKGGTKNPWTCVWTEANLMEKYALNVGFGNSL